MKFFKRLKIGTRYKVATFTLIGILLLLCTTRLYLKPADEFKNTDLRSKITLNNGTYELTSREYFKDSNILKVGIIAKEKSVGSINGITVKAIEKSSDRKPLEVTVNKINRDYYVVFVSNVPDKWVNIRLTLTDGNNLDSMMATANKFYVARDHLKSKVDFELMEKNYYELEYLNVLSDDVDKDIIKKNKSIKNLNSDSTKIEKGIEELRDSLVYKSEKEKEDVYKEIEISTKKMETNTSEVNKIKQEIADKEKSKDAIEERKTALK